LLTKSQRERLEVVLVSPRNPLNIGAAARAMVNFGFSHLAVVAPYEDHWREAKSAIGAAELLQSARRVERLAEAVADCTLVVGTGTTEHRTPEQTVVPLPELAPFVDAELTRGGRVALVFGPEKRGLTREDFALCHLLVEIPTDPLQPSMNLGQAVAVCLYELAARRPRASVECMEQSASSSADDGVSAASRDLELLADVVAETMQAANYSPAAMHKANRHDLALLLRRLALTQPDARRILGLFRRILWRLKRGDSLKD
jgi:TrmH family RNA methyltransferase